MKPVPQLRRCQWDVVARHYKDLENSRDAAAGAVSRDLRAVPGAELLLDAPAIAEWYGSLPRGVTALLSLVSHYQRRLDRAEACMAQAGAALQEFYDDPSAVAVAATPMRSADEMTPLHKRPRGDDFEAPDPVPQLSQVSHSSPAPVQAPASANEHRGAAAAHRITVRANPHAPKPRSNEAAPMIGSVSAVDSLVSDTLSALRPGTDVHAALGRIQTAAHSHAAVPLAPAAVDSASSSDTTHDDDAMVPAAPDSSDSEGLPPVLRAQAGVKAPLVAESAVPLPPKQKKTGVCGACSEAEGALLVCPKCLSVRHEACGGPAMCPNRDPATHQCAACTVDLGLVEHELGEDSSDSREGSGAEDSDSDSDSDSFIVSDEEEESDSGSSGDSTIATAELVDSDASSEDSVPQGTQLLLARAATTSSSASSSDDDAPVVATRKPRAAPKRARPTVTEISSSSDEAPAKPAKKAVQGGKKPAPKPRADSESSSDGDLLLAQLRRPARR